MNKIVARLMIDLASAPVRSECKMNCGVLDGDQPCVIIGAYDSLENCNGQLAKKFAIVRNCNVFPIERYS
jgi:hypothetical protein